MQGGNGERPDDPSVFPSDQRAPPLAVTPGTPPIVGGASRKDDPMKNGQKTTETLETLTPEELARVAGGSGHRRRTGRSAN